MTSVEKIAVSVDRELLRKAERLRGSTGETRSALVSRALRRLVIEQEHAERIEQYVEAYRRKPERPDEAELARALARRSLDGIAWEDE